MVAIKHQNGPPIITTITTKSGQNWLDPTITRHGLELVSPNWHEMCILECYSIFLKKVFIDLDLQGHLGTKTVQISKKLASLQNSPLEVMLR